MEGRKESDRLIDGLMRNRMRGKAMMGLNGGMEKPGRWMDGDKCVQLHLVV